MFLEYLVLLLILFFIYVFISCFHIKKRGCSDCVCACLQSPISETCWVQDHRNVSTVPLLWVFTLLSRKLNALQKQDIDTQHFISAPVLNVSIHKKQGQFIFIVQHFTILSVLLIHGNNISVGLSSHGHKVKVQGVAGWNGGLTLFQWKRGFEVCVKHVCYFSLSDLQYLSF